MAKAFSSYFQKNRILVIIIGLAIISRFWNLDNPADYVFDEVYHAFTAQAYAQNNPAGYEWWHSSPIEGTAYEWLHPPVAKLFMALGIVIFGNNSFGWRFFSAVFGILAIYLIYLLGKKCFDQKTGLVAAFLACLDGLLLTQSRIAMNDIFLVVFILAALYFLWEWFEKLKTRPFLLSWCMAGLACATKWSGVFLLPIFSLTILRAILTRKLRAWLRKNYWLVVKGFLLIPLIYILSYSQFWLQGHTIKQFRELHQQIWWYQTSLRATHGYQSKALSWPLMTRPVWFWVDYQGDKIANIYNRGNPVIWWSGLLILPLVIYQAARKRNKKEGQRLGLLVFGYFALWLPWAFSPRILFLHHYLPAIPFLCLMLAWFMNKCLKDKKWLFAWLALTAFIFLIFYPINIGLLIPIKSFDFLLWLPTWK